MTTPWVSESNAALLTDLYELNMLQSYFDEGMNDIAVFDLFIRRLPPTRNYLVACGLEHVLYYLESLTFSDEAIGYLRSLNRFSEPFLESLRHFRFTGDVYAVPEGTIIFANEPLIELVAPLPQAQLVETFLMNQVQMGTLAASKAARVVWAATGRSVVDFGARRMHGADAAIKQPRAFYIGGVDSTSSVLAGQIWGIPLAGTMAHSYVLAFESEIEAFRHFVRTYPTAILIVDTYDITKGIEHTIQLARELGSQFRVSGVRLDSGDLAEHAWEVRRQLDGAGLQQVKIFASSSLDEYEIQRLVSAGVPINGFGVGRNLATSADVPVLDTAYKLVEYAGKPKMKLSESKATLPGRKQIFREKTAGKVVRDVLGLMDESNVAGEPLLVKVMEDGRRLHAAEALEVCRARCRTERNSLPESVMSLSKADPGYPVELSRGLTQLQAAMLQSV
ncbi:MAG: nicotinate phosphoribosyltransferase [Acidobacteria bacterium]|nr:MAG: nicotinate phosphoribosyltransferase [Acidobacteriota bacterium]